jgi:mannosyl-3-phosphoglycerate phosphatase
VVFSDLDGTLLEPGGDFLREAGPALDRLWGDGIPLVLCTSKTFAEIEWYRVQLRNTHPFVVENGGAVYVPKGYFPFPIDYDCVVGPYLVRRLGGDYEEMVAGLQELAESTGVALRGFSSMSAKEIAEICSMSLEQADRAKRRDHDEPFLVLEPTRARLVEQSSRIPVTRAGRFHHLNTADKGTAASILIDLYRKMDKNIRTVGLGDSANDLPMLRCVDVPILVPREGGYDPDVVIPGLRLAPAAGPTGWGLELMSVLAES